MKAIQIRFCCVLLLLCLLNACVSKFAFNINKISVVTSTPEQHQNEVECLRIDFSTDRSLIDLKKDGFLSFTAYLEHIGGKKFKNMKDDYEFAEVFINEKSKRVDTINEHSYSAFIFPGLKHMTNNDPVQYFDLKRENYQIRCFVNICTMFPIYQSEKDIIITKKTIINALKQKKTSTPIKRCSGRRTVAPNLRR
jgi:hypothetical protein